MKFNFIIWAMLLFGTTVSAQLTITQGAKFSVFSDTKLALHNLDLIVNGDLLLATTSPVLFSGDQSNFIGGIGAVRFFNIAINKTANQSVSLQKSIGVGSGVFFVSGFLNLNNFDLLLETTAHLDGEREGSRVTGVNGGNVIFTTNLNAPQGSNPANLGLFITSPQDLGNVVIKRGHQSQAVNGAGKTILRYYDITPDNNSNLNATLRFGYMDGELNGIDEAGLTMLENHNNTTWSNIGLTSIDVVANVLVKSGIGNFGRYTLSNANNPLPVRFTAFDVRCQGSLLLLTWKTAQEQNSSHYNIERSADGVSWTVIGNTPAAGNSNTERSYAFTDRNPVKDGFYRIAEVDRDGKLQYTNVLRASCDLPDAFTLWPNPVRDRAIINIVAGSESQAVIKLFDSKGAMLKLQQSTLLRGSNQVVLDMKTFSNGVYHLSVTWYNGKTQRNLRVVKQL
ncbi:MAG TPA: T9SS type A sorting domain-containing protein [Chitinophagaceae bacterium]